MALHGQDPSHHDHKLDLPLRTHKAAQLDKSIFTRYRGSCKILKYTESH